jgi:hypothetical protein
MKSLSKRHSSLKAFLDRISRPSRFSVSGLSIQKRQQVAWNLPWEFSSRAIGCVSAILVVLIGLWLLYSWLRSRGRAPDGVLYSLMLFTLLFFPNLQRYDHILALPAMPWLWHGSSRDRNLTIAAYALFALSRLNHLWATLLPSPFAPMASGFGLLAVLLLLAGVSYNLAGRKGQASTTPSHKPSHA